MIAEAVVLALMLAVGFLAFARQLPGGRSRRLLVASLVALAVASAAAAFHYGGKREAEEVAPPGPAVELVDDYVGSGTCRSCHVDNYASWFASYHRTMTQQVRPETALGDFDGVRLELFGRDYQLTSHDDGLWVEMDDLRGGSPGVAPRIERPIVLSTGSHHMQVYWFPSGDDRGLGQLPFVYLREDDRWIPRVSAFIMPPADHASWELGRWNVGCVKCHTTHGRPRVGQLPPTGPPALDTLVTEFGITCEACHGPGAEHVRANHDPLRRYSMHLNEGEDPTIVNPIHLTHQRSSEVCGQCHSVFVLHDRPALQDYFAHGFDYRPGDELSRSKKILHAGDDTFWSDGMVRVAGREYNGLIGSPCYAAGELSCFSCHELHPDPDDPRPLPEWANDQLAPGLDGDEACLQCHGSYRNDPKRHTFHDAASSGSRCYNCHMPYTSYGLFKAIRSHTIDNPTVQASLATGRPNACNQCHLDKTLEWTAEYLQRWYETPKPELDADETAVAASVLWTLRGDAAQRALMAWSMGWDEALVASGSDWIPPYLATLLADPYDAVRFIAQRSLRRRPGFEDFEYDFVAPSDRLAVAPARAFEIWRRTAAPLPDGTGPVLIGPDGALDLARIRLLAEQRDDRDVWLAE